MLLSWPLFVLRRSVVTTLRKETKHLITVEYFFLLQQIVLEIYKHT